jgi:actin-like ATPase involved in cell morphogenesis
VLNEPSVVAIASVKGKRLVLVWARRLLMLAARRAASRRPPLRDGVIADLRWRRK